MPTKAPTHRAASAPTPRAQLSAHARGYDRRWQAARLAFLATNPLCVHCLALTPRVIAEATVVDHITPHRGNQSLFWDTLNWQPLCVPCHARKTAAGQ